MVNFHASSRKPENLHFDKFFLSKSYKILNEKVQKIYVSWHWRVMQRLKKNWLPVPKMTWRIPWMLMRAVQIWKFELWCATFVESILCLSQKREEELCVIITLKGDIIFKETLTGGLKNDIRNLVNFHASSHKSENLHFDGLVLSKAYKVLDEKAQKSYVSRHWKVMKIKANSWEICIFCMMQ